MKLNLPPEMLEGQRILVTGASIQELTNWGWSLAVTTSSIVRFLRARKMLTATSLFDECSAALQFPYYFGENWDALDECLADLEWLGSDMVVVVITESEKLLADRNHFRTFVELMIDTSLEHERSNQKFVTLLQCSSIHEGELKKALSDFAIDFHWFQ